MIRGHVRPPQIRLYNEVVVDLFAGGGGTSTGIEAVLGRPPDVAINHDKIALAMHKANHPTTEHLKADVFEVDPVVACKGKRCAFAWFSPDCTYHSKARGGKPFRDRNRARRIRGLAWVMVKWAESKAKPRILFMENVEEIADWGPLDADGVPDPKRKGQSWRRLCARIRSAGYELEVRELRASPYGAPTSRKRLFMVARSDGS